MVGSTKLLYSKLSYSKSAAAQLPQPGQSFITGSGITRWQRVKENSVDKLEQLSSVEPQGMRTASGLMSHFDLASLKLSEDTMCESVEDLPDDIQIHILAFLSLADARSLMAAGSRYRNVLFTRDAQQVWQNWCQPYNWPQLENGNIADEVRLVDDLNLSAAAQQSIPSGEMTLSWARQVNLSLLLTMAQRQPDSLDNEQLIIAQNMNGNRSVSQEQRPRHHERSAHSTVQTPPLMYIRLEDSNKWVVQFTGRVGQGDRCVRANRALPIPRHMVGKLWRIEGNSRQCHPGLFNSPGSRHRQALRNTFRWSTGFRSRQCPVRKPFVAPFVTESAVHLTPRFFSYFEVAILAANSTGDNERPAHQPQSTQNNTCVAVGVATKTFNWHSRMPGWDDQSFGYHGDDGGIFHATGHLLREFGPKFGIGDIVGCGIDHVTNGIFYTLNGNPLGYAWNNLPTDMLSQDMYPVVGIDTNDYIHVNLGTEPFAYDLTSKLLEHGALIKQMVSSPL